MESKNLNSATNTVVIKLPKATVNWKNACTTDLKFFGACSYENARPVGENIISPVVSTKYCGNCHKMFTELGGDDSIRCCTNADNKNEIPAKIPPTNIRCNGRCKPIFLKSG